MFFTKLFSAAKEPINYPREIMGGITNFMAIAYIIAINPLILNADGHGFPILPMVTATVITIIVATLLASCFIKLPFVIAPGMGINALVSYTLILHDHLPLGTALAVIFFAGLLLLIISLSNLRQKILGVIPQSVRLGLGCGIGFFLIFIGFKNIQLITFNPNTLLSIGKINLEILLVFAGFILATVLLMKKKNYAFLLPIILITVICFLLGKVTLPHQLLATPDFSLFMSIDFKQALNLSLIPVILSVFLVNFFDASSTAIGVLAQVKQDYTANNYYLKRSLIVDSIGAMFSGIAGTSSATIFVESSAAIQNGAKTGFASFITALCCLPFLFCAPLLAIIPVAATAPVLILVGMLMLSNIRRINMINLEDLISTILTIIMMPLCFSITAGAVFGIISYTLLKILLGKFNEISPMLVVVALGCCGWFFL